MGQQQSSEKVEKADKAPRGQSTQTDKEKKIGRRTSIQMLTGRSGPADPSASNESATAQSISQPIPKSALREQLQSASPELSSKAKVERSASRGAARKRDSESRQVENIPIPGVPTGPVNVPTASKSKHDDYDDRSAFQQRNYPPVSQLRPPRLPLPIADVAIPESPILQPVDKRNEDIPIFEDDEPVSSEEVSHHRRTSATSTTTQDEEEIHDELQPYAVDTTTEAVPTLIEWNHPSEGEKVYVTGSFASWGKKYRLYERKDGRGFAATIALPPGTHHLLFFLGISPKTNPDIPTTVDMNNVLVNYIEVIPEEVARSRRESSQRPTKQLAIPINQQVPPEEQEHFAPGEETPDDYEEPEEPQEEEIPPGDFRQIIPQALLDIDYAEDDPRYHQAVQVIQESAAPPALPMFLGKSILNGNLPMKDDASVLTLPNHTVLNHLATSSVRNGVLATSVTTRYKKKYVTTIVYKPVPRPVHS